MKISRRVAGLCTLGLLSTLGTLAHAATSTSTWATHGELGIVMARGNANTNSGDVKLAVARRLGRWTDATALNALYASTNGITTAQDVGAHLRLERALGKRTFWFGGVLYDRNLFSGFAYQASAASGIGRVVLHSHADKLTAEIGAGFRRELPEQLVENTFGAVTSRTRLTPVDDAVLHAGAQYRHRISADSSLLNTVLVESGSSDTMSADDLSLQVKMRKTLALSVGVQVTNNTNPPPGKVRHTDTVMTVNLVYNFRAAKLAAQAPTQALLQGLNLP